MKLECTIGIIIDGNRVRVGDIIDEQSPLFETAELFSKPRTVKDKKINTVYFSQVDGQKKNVEEPKSISDIARERQYNPPASMRKK